MSIILFTTFLWTNPDSKIALAYTQFKENLDVLVFLKIIIFLVVTITVIRLVSKNLNNWSGQFVNYMKENFRKSGMTFFLSAYKLPLMKYQGHMIIIFGAFMVIFLTFAFLFGPIDTTDSKMQAYQKRKDACLETQKENFLSYSKIEPTNSSTSMTVPISKEVSMEMLQQYCEAECHVNLACDKFDD